MSDKPLRRWKYIFGNQLLSGDDQCYDYDNDDDDDDIDDDDDGDGDNDDVDDCGDGKS